MPEGIRIRCSDTDGFTMFYIPSRKLRKEYSDCPLCRAILNEKIFFSDVYSAVVNNKYPVIDDSKLFLSGTHASIFNKAYLKSLYKMISRDNLIGLYDDPSTMSVPGHLHVELINRRFFDPKFSDSLLAPISIFTGHVIPLLAVDSADLDLFLSVYEKIKSLNYKCNSIFTREKILFHLVSPAYSGKKLGAKECIKIFSTSHEDIFEGYRRSMLATLLSGSFSNNEYFELMKKLEES